MKKSRLLFVPLSCLAIIGLTLSAPGSQIVSALTISQNTMVDFDYTNTGIVSRSGGNPYAAMSDDGNFVAFLSTGNGYISTTNTNSAAQDLYIRNLSTNTNEQVGVSTAGVEPQLGVSERFAISRTGRYVAFVSNSPNLIDGTTLQPVNGTYVEHTYLRDTGLDTTVLVDQNSVGTISNKNTTVNAVSDDGRFITYTSLRSNIQTEGQNNIRYVYMKDMSTSIIKLISANSAGTVANADSNNIFANTTMSCDGAFALFTSTASNLGDSTGTKRAYLVDMRSGFKVTAITPASVPSTAKSISCDGRYVLILSTATNLTSDSVDGAIEHLFRYDRISGQFELIDKSPTGIVTPSNTYMIYAPALPFVGRSVSDTGKVAFRSYDNTISSTTYNGRFEPYLRSPEANTTELIAVNSSGAQASPVMTSVGDTLSISSTGKKVVYNTTATNLVPQVTTSKTYNVVADIQ